MRKRKKREVIEIYVPKKREETCKTVNSVSLESDFFFFFLVRMQTGAESDFQSAFYIFIFIVFHESSGQLIFSVFGN